MLFAAAADHSNSGHVSLLQILTFKYVDQLSQQLMANYAEESLFPISDPFSGANDYNENTDTSKTEEVLLFTGQTDH